mgnify:CR=1 FL=1|jgi:hypothetical protein
MVEQASDLMGSDDMLREILRKQEEALDLKGQLVILNGKMDTLIETMDKKVKPQSMVAAMCEASPQIPLYMFIIVIISLFLGFGPELISTLGGK